MNSLEALINSGKYDTDKSIRYLNNYEQMFQPYIDKEIKILELGINKGGSLLLWRDYFKRGDICGLDISPTQLEDPTGRIHAYQGRQDDTCLLDKIANERAPEGFDVIIDDCSHIGELTRISFWHLFKNHLKKGGLYIIEDWRTGYWNKWLDGRQYNPRNKTFMNKLRAVLRKTIDLLPINKRGKLYYYLDKAIYYKQRSPSHDYGMVGFIKELIDECGMDMITYPDRNVLPKILPQRDSMFENIHISGGQVFIVKRY